MSNTGRPVRALVLVATCVLWHSAIFAQIRVLPDAPRGGEAQGVAWDEVPDSFRSLPLPTWQPPTDLAAWNESGRAAVKNTLVRLLGKMPTRPAPSAVKVIGAREERDGYSIERIEFFNGVDSTVRGVLLLPHDTKHAAPAIVALHGHGSTKESVTTDLDHPQCVGPSLARRGYVVAAIDGYFNGERIGRGPAGRLDRNKHGQEASLFKLNLWLGRTLWGMMLRDEQILLDYLETRSEVDRDRIGATGMSMGCTRSWWLAAIDDRVKAIVGVACFTRYTDLIAHGNLRRHGIYYFVPGLLEHFDTEAIFSLVAPRPMLMLSGDQDGGAPTDGIIALEKKLDGVYRLHGAGEKFRSVLYRDTGHEYLAEMKDEMLRWFTRWLPVEGAGPIERKAAEPFWFAQMADPQFGFFDKDRTFDRETVLYEKAIAAANRLGPRFVINCGDLVNKPGDPAQIAELLRITKKLKPQIPMFWVAGNHDVENVPTAQSLAAYRKIFGPDRYSFHYRRSHFIVINTCVCQHPEKVPAEWDGHLAFLREKLAESKREGDHHSLVFGHHPFFLKSVDEADAYWTIPQERRKLLIDLFAEHGVTAIFSGHYHRNNLAQHGDLQMITTGPVGKPLGKDPSGFRIVKVRPDRIEHAYHGLDAMPQAVDAR